MRPIPEPEFIGRGVSLPLLAVHHEVQHAEMAVRLKQHHVDLDAVAVSEEGLHWKGSALGSVIQAREPSIDLNL